MLCCNKNYQQKFDEKSKERFLNMYKFSNHDNHNKTLPEKEDFYSHLNMEDITDADYAHLKKVCKDFKMKNLGEHHDLYVLSDTFLLADIFKNFRNRCLRIYELDPAKFRQGHGLACQAALKKTKVKLDLLTNVDMLFTVEEDFRERICHSIY